MADSSSQQAAQAGLASLVIQDIEGAWPHLDPADLKRTLPRFTTLIYALVHKYGPISGALSGRFYQQQRIAAGLGIHTARVAPTPPLQQVAKSIQWATNDLWADPAALEPARTKVDGAVTKLVQDVGRRTVIDSVHADPKARAWARVPEADPCAFCALLSTRGAVYKAEHTADFKSHDHCRCHAEPVFTAYEPSAQIRQWMADYKQATRGVRGGGTNLLNAWRQSFEGRN